MQKMRKGDYFQTSYFLKSFTWGKNKWSAASFQYTDSPQFGVQKNKLYTNLDYWSRDMFNFDFLKKSLGIVPPPNFVNDFSRKSFSCSIILTNQFSLPDWFLNEQKDNNLNILRTNSF